MFNQFHRTCLRLGFVISGEGNRKEQTILTGYGLFHASFTKTSYRLPFKPLVQQTSRLLIRSTLEYAIKCAHTPTTDSDRCCVFRVWKTLNLSER